MWREMSLPRSPKTRRRRRARRGRCRRPKAAPEPFCRSYVTFAIRRASGSRRCATRIARTPPQRALDVAMGRGRHALLLARHGFHDVRRRREARRGRDAIASAARDGLTIRGWCADLTMYPLPRERVRLVVVTRYLQRDLFPSITRRRAAGRLRHLRDVHGRAARARRRARRRRITCCEPGELRASFDGWDMLFYEEVVRRSRGADRREETAKHVAAGLACRVGGLQRV